MAMSALSITPLRSTIIDYTAPYYSSGFSLLSIEREPTDSQYFSFLEPFPPEVWQLILLCACITFVCLVCKIVGVVFSFLPSNIIQMSCN